MFVKPFIIKIISLFLMINNFMFISPSSNWQIKYQARNISVNNVHNFLELFKTPVGYNVYVQFYEL